MQYIITRLEAKKTILEVEYMEQIQIVLFPILIVAFYFILIRPESKKKKKVAQMRSELAVGDEITTIGGMVGKICTIKDDLITFETGEDRVRIQVARWAIHTTGFDVQAKS
jgi:preprotein translocase subunit YajC